MKIVIFSINPVFPTKVTGGASKHLYQVARHLGSLGHTVEIICAKPEEPLAPFQWDEHVSVSPVLPFHLPFPQPYAVSGGELALIIQTIADTLADADRFYIHDGEFLLPDVYQEIPTVVSLRDNVYPESVLGSFVGKYDDLICVSSYSADVVLASAGRFYPGLHQRLHQVNNGIDFDHFKPVDPMPLARELGLDPANRTILLHPHRPEPGKGLPETIAVVDRLVHEFGVTDLVVLVPEWIDSMVSKDESDDVHQMTKMMEDLDIRRHFKFIPWIPAARMPEFYSLGQATLCLGNIVEAFGNVAYESLACGTPSVVSNVGVHRTLLPDDLIEKVDYGDISGAAKSLMDIIESKRGVSTETMAYIQGNLDYEAQMEAYGQIITSASKKTPTSFKVPDDDQDTKFYLAPWCYFKGDQIYHDFHGRFEGAAILHDLLDGKANLTANQTHAAGFSKEIWQHWIDQTYIVPEWKN